jgi:hypothetical protein
MIKNFCRTFFTHAAFVFALFTLAMPDATWAQTYQPVCQANEMDADTTFQVELCKAHAGCALVFKIAESCIKAKRFLTTIGKGFGDGVKSLLGSKPELTDEMVFEAAVPDNARRLSASDADWAARTQKIKDSIAKTKPSTLSGRNDKTEWVYRGEVKDGMADGNGTFYFGNGTVQRGQFTRNLSNGETDIASPDGRRYVGNVEWDQQNGDGLVVFPNGEHYKGGFHKGNLSGAGKYTYKDGSRHEGNFAGNAPYGNGKYFSPDGKLAFEGFIDAAGQLSVGKIYKKDGTFETVDKPVERQRLVDQQQKLEAERLQKIALEKAAAEKAFLTSLRSMNAGALFLKIDELKTAGDIEKGNIVAKTLISTYPDHAFSKLAAERLSGVQTAPSAQQNTATAKFEPTRAEPSSGSRNQSSNAGATGSKYSSVCARNMAKIEKLMIEQDVKSGASMFDYFWYEANKKTMSVYQPCTGTDEKANKAVAGIQKYIREFEAHCASNQCRQWGFAEDVNRRFAAWYSRETSLALSNPEYSADMELNPRDGADKGASQCDIDMAIAQRSYDQFKDNAGMGDRPKVVVASQILMFLLREHISVIKSGCPESPRHKALLKGFQETYASTEAACNAVASTKCKPEHPAMAVEIKRGK